MKTGDLIELKISDIAFGGEGVGRVNDFVVFVPYVALGESVQAEVTEVKKSFARARLLKVLEASSDRVASSSNGCMPRKKKRTPNWYKPCGNAMVAGCSAS